MEFIFELIFEIFGEILLQGVAEVLVELGLHRARGPERRAVSPWLAVTGYATLGAICGAITVWLFPTFFIPSHGGRVASLIVTPLAAGAMMSMLGAWRRRRGEELLRLDRFAYGYVFALAMAVVRFCFADLG